LGDREETQGAPETFQDIQVIRDGKYRAREIRLRYREIKGKYREIKENFLCRNISSRSRKIFVLKNQSFNAPEWKNKWDSKG
jgi:hypothetical protein